MIIEYYIIIARYVINGAQRWYTDDETDDEDICPDIHEAPGHG